ncbi:hypothetical protein EVAR_86827_1 [Eumeta japonica]|uniref:Uncharacterized protein n=1 Tax=Eumeta variegata TaxID=151549 RepID=A0A4C1VVH8_EUMVA|nr:hypothetical protein EVAR_86827_1 [Eumeta japonica]
MMMSQLRSFEEDILRTGNRHAYMTQLTYATEARVEALVSAKVLPSLAVLDPYIGIIVMEFPLIFSR